MLKIGLRTAVVAASLLLYEHTLVRPGDLRRLDAARSLTDLALVRGDRLEKLAGNRVGQWSIRINGQWRICFTWEAGPENVEIVDYH